MTLYKGRIKPNVSWSKANSYLWPITTQFLVSFYAVWWVEYGLILNKWNILFCVCFLFFFLSPGIIYKILLFYWKGVKSTYIPFIFVPCLSVCLNSTNFAFVYIGFIIFRNTILICWPQAHLCRRLHVETNTWIRIHSCVFVQYFHIEYITYNPL